MRYTVWEVTFMNDTISLKEATAPYMAQPAHSFELVIPPFFEWLAYFDAEERAMFYQELFQAIAQAVGASRWDGVAELIEAWRLTAEERTDTELQSRLETARREIATGGGHNWESMKRELDL